MINTKAFVLACFVAACGSSAPENHDSSQQNDSQRVDGSLVGPATCSGADPVPEAAVDEATNCYTVSLAYGTRRLCLNDSIVLCDAEPGEFACDLSCVPDSGWMPSLSWEIATVEMDRRPGSEHTEIEAALSLDVNNRGMHQRGLTDVWQYLEYAVDGGPASSEYFPGSTQEVVVPPMTMSTVSVTLNFGVPNASPLASASVVSVMLRARPTDVAPFGPAFLVNIVDVE